MPFEGNKPALTKAVKVFPCVQQAHPQQTVKLYTTKLKAKGSIICQKLIALPFWILMFWF